MVFRSVDPFMLAPDKAARRLRGLRCGRRRTLLGGALTANKDRHKYIPILYLILLSMPFWAYGDSHMVTQGGLIANNSIHGPKYNDLGPAGPIYLPEIGVDSSPPPFQAGSGASALAHQLGFTMTTNVTAIPKLANPWSAMAFGLEITN